MTEHAIIVSRSVMYPINTQMLVVASESQVEDLTRRGL